MLNSLEEIQKNGIVNRFKEVAESYGLYGTYVRWQPGSLNDEGIYFVCGFDKSKIMGHNIEMFQILENQRRNHNCIHTDVTAFKVTGKHPFMLHSDIINHCHMLSMLNNVYSHVGVPLPSKVSASVAETMRMTWNNFTDPTKSIQKRNEYEKILAFAVKTEAVGTIRNVNENKKASYVENGYYDSGKNKLYNWFKRHFAKHKNKVSLTHLVSHSGRIGSAKITFKNYDKIRKELDKRPEILYSFSHVKGNVLDISDSEGYGSKENNDRRYYILYYPFYCAKDIEEIIQKVNYPAEYNRTLEDIDPHGFGTEHLIIPVEYFDMFKKACDESNIQFCIDKTSRDTVADGVAIAFSSTNSHRIYGYLNGIIDASEHYKLKGSQPPQIKSHNKSIDEIIPTKTVSTTMSSASKIIDMQTHDTR